MKMGKKTISDKDIRKWMRIKNMIVCPECSNQIKPYKTHGIVGCPCCGAEWNSMAQLRTEMEAKQKELNEGYP